MQRTSRCLQRTLTEHLALTATVLSGSTNYFRPVEVIAASSSSWSWLDIGCTLSTMERLYGKLNAPEQSAKSTPLCSTSILGISDRFHYKIRAATHRRLSSDFIQAGERDGATSFIAHLTPHLTSNLCKSRLQYVWIRVHSVPIIYLLLYVFKGLILIATCLWIFDIPKEVQQ